MRWLITDKGDQDARRLADRHYTRQTVGDIRFTRNGQNLVFITEELDAAWVTFRPTPGKATRADGLDAWECALFRNEGRYLSSGLIREAVELSCALWGAFPKDGLLTYVQPGKVKWKRDPGYCFLMAGWVQRGTGADGKPRFFAPEPETVQPWTDWDWHGERGGKLRRELEAA